MPLGAVQNGFGEKTIWELNVQGMRFKFTVGMALAFGSRAALGADGTPIGELAESMQPGQWRELATTGAQAAFSADESLFEYCDKLVWDPIQKQVLFYGTSDPASSNNDRKFIRYRASTNSWDILPTPSFASNIQHSYKHHAINPENRRLYYRPMGSTNTELYSISLDNVTGAWRRESNISGLDYLDGAVAMDWFPARRTIVLHSGEAGGAQSGLTEFNATTNTWRTIADNFTPRGGLHALIECSPAANICIFGGGDDTKNLWRLNADGTTQNLGSTGPIAERSTRFAITTTDPVTGRFLMMSRNDEFYEFDATVGTTGRWTLIGSGTSVPPFNGYVSNDSTFHMSATPISNYGVVMYVQWRDTGSKVWLYKHSASTQDALRPNPPAAFTAL